MFCHLLRYLSPTKVRWCFLKYLSQNICRLYLFTSSYYNGDVLLHTCHLNTKHLGPFGVSCKKGCTLKFMCLDSFLYLVETIPFLPVGIISHYFCVNICITEVSDNGCWRKREWWQHWGCKEENAGIVEKRVMYLDNVAS